jgi:hypothetical protein
MNQAILNKSRSDKFLMVLDIPIELKKRYDNVLKTSYKANTIQYTIYGSPVPSIAVPPIDVPYDGQVYRASSMSRPAYDPLNIRFFVDNGYKNYWIIWQWLNLFNDARYSNSNIRIENPNQTLNVDAKMKTSMKDLVSIMRIYGLDEYNNKAISFTYDHVFPISLGEINYSHQDPSEITCNASFVFNQLHVEMLKNVDEGSC